MILSKISKNFVKIVILYCETIAFLNLSCIFDFKNETGSRTAIRLNTRSWKNRGRCKEEK